MESCAMKHVMCFVAHRWWWKMFLMLHITFHGCYCFEKIIRSIRYIRVRFKSVRFTKSVIFEHGL